MSKKMILGLLAMMVLSASMAQAATISIVDLPATGTDDAIDINIGKTYTHTFDFGSNAPVTINDVAFEQGPTASMSSVYTGTSSWGYGYTIDDTRRPMNVPVHAGPSDAPADGSSNGLFMDFIYHSGGPVGDGSILTLSDLTAGTIYSMRWYYGPFGIGAGRVITFEADGQSNGIFSDTIELSLDTGGAHYLDYTFTADDTDVTLRFITHNDNQSAHIYGLSNEVIGLPANASGPNPADGVEDVPRDVVLSWQPGIFAAPVNGHKVYLSENFNDVNDGIGGITQDANSYARPQRLDFSTIYYWRIDEVNAPPDSTIFKGGVWSFTTEPVGYPIAGENITATASSTHQADTGPENSINGSGLDANDLHSVEPTDMWLSGSEPNGAWIEYELDKVYKLHQMWVWNSNQIMESLIGFGLKDVTIEYSTNGTDYTTLGTTHEFVRAPGAPDYAHNTIVDFGSAAAKYVRLTANNNWGGILEQYGLSEVRFFSIPVFAREPSPDSGATDVSIGTIDEPIDVTLGFRAGREAVTHDVYLSTDEQAVIDGNAPVSTVAENSHGPLSLDLGTTYYWRVDEVNEAEAPTTWQGEIWNFSTPEFFVVDDFEDYNDYPPNEIWFTWVDGYGNPANGATSGYPNPDFLAGEHYMETTIVRGGEQSMPFFYDNTGTATYSEGERTFAVPQDWTKAGVQTLALYFFGTAGNTGQLYVKVNGFKVVYDGDASNLGRTGWQPWNIELASFGTNLQSVTTLAIGIDDIGASGTLYFDDIRLYPYSREFITPAEPNSAGLVGHWKFDEVSGTIAYDSSGNGNDGTLQSDPQWVAGMIGSGALSFDGTDGYVEIVDAASLSMPDTLTITVWVNVPDLNAFYMLVCKQPSGTARDNYPGNYEFRIQANTGILEFGHQETEGEQYTFYTSDLSIAVEQWHHVAIAVTKGESVEFYIDGVAAGSAEQSTNFGVLNNNPVRIGSRTDLFSFFNGLLDDIRLYDYALSYGEVGWLAGRTEPFDKPF